VAKPGDRNITQKEPEKKLKYKSLCKEIQWMWNMKCMIILVITGATGIVTKDFTKSLEAIPGKHSIEYIQKTAILVTSHIIWKVLQSETRKLSSGEHSWFKRSTREKSPVTRDNKLIILVVVVVVVVVGSGGWWWRWPVYWLLNCCYWHNSTRWNISPQSTHKFLNCSSYSLQKLLIHKTNNAYITPTSCKI
jgi:di/tricarboxylate transporter